MSSTDYADSGYVDVATRAAEFFRRYPEGSLRPANPDEPYAFIHLDETTAAEWMSKFGGTKWAKGYTPTTFIVYTAAAYRTPDDPSPGIGVAMEPFPGLTPYTHNSELMNAETSAWGRAIVAVGAAEARASAQEVGNRRAEQDDAHAPVDMRDAALTALGEWVEMFDGDGEATARWAQYKAEHPAWFKSIEGIHAATGYVGTILAGLGLEPWDDPGDAESPVDVPEPDDGADTAADDAEPAEAVQGALVGGEE